VRGDAVRKLPDVERAAWHKLWVEVDALLNQVERRK
jgi:hypothetical protein